VTRVGAELGADSGAPAGTVLEISREGARIACGAGSLWIAGLAAEGRGIEPGARLRVGERLA
jgi:methionyl-tRNA formyltransferase